MSEDRRAGKGRSLKAPRAVAGAATAKSIKVRMTKTMAGPNGSRHPDEVVDLPKAEANALVKAGAAVAVPSARRKAETTLVEPTPKDPFTDEGLNYGVELDPFLEWYAPEDFTEAEENYRPIFSIYESWGPKDERWAAANRRLRERLSAALKSGEYELRYLPLDDPGADWVPVKRHRYPEIVKQVSYGLSGIPKRFKLEGCDRPVSVRVFRRRHRKESPKSADTWAVDGLEKIESEYQAKIDAGKAPRKPLIEELMKQLTKKNPNLSKTAFRRAWKNSDIPGLKKGGAPKGHRPSRP